MTEKSKERTRKRKHKREGSDSRYYAKSGERSRSRKGSRSKSAKKGKRRRREREHTLNPREVVNRWWDRLLDVADKRSFSKGASEYEANQTTNDYVLNTLGLAAWGALFPILSIIATQLAGAEQAGMFSMAFTTATLLLYVGNYGVRTYQVSDIDEADSFASYQVQRIITVVIMLLMGWMWCAVKGYDQDMTLITWGAFGFRAVDALADVYEGRLQQMGKLYLSGVSQAVRSVLGIIVFFILLLVTRNLVVASIGMAISAVATFVLLSLPLAFMETPKSRSIDRTEIIELFVECFPSFAALFLFALIETVPKFAMEGVLPYDNQVFFNAIYFPAQAILMIVGFVYKPQLVRIASVWADKSKRASFDVIVFAMLMVCVAVTVVMLFVFGAVGVWLNGLMYGVDFEPYRMAQYLMIIAGGFSAGIDFLYQVITVLRRQAQATITYFVSFVLVTLAAIILIRLVGFDGAVYSYLAVMVALFVMLGVQYALIRYKRT